MYIYNMYVYIYIYIKNTVISSHGKGSKWKWYDGYQHIERLAIESYGKKNSTALQP